MAKALRSKLPDARLILAADNDIKEGKPNYGLEKAWEAAAEVRGFVAVPELDGAKADFNDILIKRGPDAVKAAIHGALPPAPKEQQQDGAMHAALKTAASEANVAGWQEIQPLSVDHHRGAYPMDALPVSIRAAVQEVVSFVQCPESLAACSALSALSVAGQALVDVERAGTLNGPTSLYLLAIAESGERKTSCDKYFTAALREWERNRREAIQPRMAEKRAAFTAWEAKKEAAVLAIKAARKNKEPTGPEEAELVKLEQAKPSPERWPQLLHAETNPRVIGLGLVEGWRLALWRHDRVRSWNRIRQSWNAP